LKNFITIKKMTVITRYDPLLRKLKIKNFI